MQQGSTKPTQKTIAKIMGLAVTTVSRALNEDPKIAKATRVEVAKVAEEIGYVPDRAAQRLRTGKTRVIGLMLSPHDEIFGFGNSMIEGLTRSLEGSGYHLIITPTFSGGDEMAPIKHVIRNGLADGLVLTRTRNFDERIRYLMEEKFPFISHGRTDFSLEHNFVDFDNEAFAYQAAKRLAGLGCNRLSVILPKEGFTFHQHLRYGFMRAVREGGLDYVIPDTVSLDSNLDAIRAWAVDLLSNRKEGEIFGFVCPGETSYLALNAGLRNIGLKRGVDYRAVVKTSSVILRQISPNLDRVYEDIENAGFLMGEALLSLLEGRGQGLSKIIQEPKISFHDM
ncbi:LacI family transcriptional regulator [uncultured Cohaesibacter sp.]|uniref:LacI family transcriptional regulator n=1 Tax=uncultured Cohaesibacter sp. TaxID=1002546 RepID=UPI0029C623EA|nr:LacI family transcriptional regulator [uncultured Cohaesibacter sp.]